MNETRLGREIVVGDIFYDLVSKHVVRISESADGLRIATVQLGYSLATIEIPDGRTYRWCEKHRRFSERDFCSVCYGESLGEDGARPLFYPLYQCLNPLCRKKWRSRDAAVNCCQPIAVDSWLCGTNCWAGGFHESPHSALACIRDAKLK